MLAILGLVVVFGAVLGGFLLEKGNPNAARRLLHSDGLPPAQIVEVRGFADQRLLVPENPEDPRNRRVSVVIKFSVDSNQ